MCGNIFSKLNKTLAVTLMVIGDRWRSVFIACDAEKEREKESVC